MEEAEVGDAIAVHIRDIEVTSVTTSTGSMTEREDAFGDDHFADHRCPECGNECPKSIGEGIGEDAIRCAECGANASSFGFALGYTIAFDDDHTVGLTMDEDAAASLAKRADDAMALHKHSRQHPGLLHKPAEMPGILDHFRPFIRNISTTPTVELPDSYNAGDFGQFLTRTGHNWGLDDEDELAEQTGPHGHQRGPRERHPRLAP